MISKILLSNLNLSIDSKIMESVIEQSHVKIFEESLIDYAIEYNAINIFKYLIMNNAYFTEHTISNSSKKKMWNLKMMIKF